MDSARQQGNWVHQNQELNNDIIWLPQTPTNTIKCSWWITREFFLFSYRMSSHEGHRKFCFVFLITLLSFSPLNFEVMFVSDLQAILNIENSWHQRWNWKRRPRGLPLFSLATSFSCQIYDKGTKSSTLDTSLQN